MSQTTDPRLGTSLGGYRIDSQIGRGGMGVVYLAEDVHLGRKVALKLLAPDLGQDAKFRERFIRESRLAASLEHPNIVTVYEAREAEGQLYLAMRYVAGTDLKRLITAEGPVDPERTISIISQAASALDAAHAEGLVHRDVKPGNILIAPRTDPGGRDRVYLSDFGLTKRATSDSGITATGQFVGTLDYAAPEQFEARALDGRSDVYSLGCVLYECLTGEVPYLRQNQAALVYAHLSAPAPKVTATRPDLPPAIDPVLAAALAKSPEDRYQTAGDLAGAAAEALGVQTTAPPTTPTRPVPTPPRRRRPTVLVAVGAVALALVGLIVVALVVTNGGTNPPRSPVAAPAAVTDYVARVDPATRQVVARIPLGEHPIDVAVGEGSVWVLDRGGSVRRIDPVSNRATVIEGVAQSPSAIAAGVGGVWVADGAKGVHRIDPASNRVEGSVRMGGVTNDVTVGPDAVWVAAGDRLVRLDPSSEEVTEAAGGLNDPGAGDRPQAPLNAVDGAFVWQVNSLTLLYRYEISIRHLDVFNIEVEAASIAARRGAVWLAGCGTPGRVVRVDGETGETAAAIAAGGAICTFARLPQTDIAAGEEGVWVTDSVNGSVSRIREVDDGVDQPIKVGDTPTAVAVGLGSVWVAVDGEPSPSPSTS